MKSGFVDVSTLPINILGGVDIPALSMVPDGSVIPDSSTIGDKCHIGSDVKIGKYSVMGTDCVVGPRPIFEDYCTLVGGINVGHQAHFGHEIKVGPDCTFGGGVSFGSECTFCDKAHFLGYARFGDNTIFRGLTQFVRPVIVGIGSVFAAGRPMLVIDPHRDIVRAERKHGTTKDSVHC